MRLPGLADSERHFIVRFFIFALGTLEIPEVSRGSAVSFLAP